MSIHPIPPRSSHQQTFDASSQAHFRHLRQQGMAATEAWSQVRARVLAITPDPLRKQDSALASPVEDKVPDLQLIERQEFWDMTPIGLIVLLVIWWVLRQLFWLALWLAGLIVRVIIGLLFFGLGMIIGYRVFRDR